MFTMAFFLRIILGKKGNLLGHFSSFFIISGIILPMRAADYNIFAIPLDAGILVYFGVIIDPAVGAILMPLSTVLVAVNSQTLRRYEPKVETTERIMKMPSGHEEEHMSM